MRATGATAAEEGKRPPGGTFCHAWRNERMFLCHWARNATLREIAHAKWSLWHGNHWEAKLYLDTLNIGDLPEDHPKVQRIWEVAKDLSNYLDDNDDMLVDYCSLYHEGRPISTAPAESAVNYLLKKRMSKRQQMGWTPEGAHFLLQVRAEVLNGEIEQTFRRWYPGTKAA